MSAGELSKARLERMHDVMARYVERGDLPGLVTLVSRRGEVHIDAIGTLAVDGSAPMRHDTIFRISSMTKPVTAAATMALVDDGTLKLDEPVDGLIPELADRRVLRRGGLYLFNVWDRIEENEFADAITTALESVFPNDPPRFGHALGELEAPLE